MDVGSRIETVRHWSGSRHEQDEHRSRACLADTLTGRAGPKKDVLHADESKLERLADLELIVERLIQRQQPPPGVALRIRTLANEEAGAWKEGGERLVMIRVVYADAHRAAAGVFRHVWARRK